MKKATAVFLAFLLLLIGTLALAEATEIDLSGMSYEELVALKDKVSKAMWESEDWQEVTVPAGVYVIGEDIPEGHWTIIAPDKQRVSIRWGDSLAEGGRDITYDGKIYEYESLYSENYRSYSPGDKTQVDFDMKAGQYLIVDDGDAVFMPYIGKPSLGFK